MRSSSTCHDRGMPEFSEYPPGTPSWVDLGSPDVDASARFYGELFGWQAAEAGPPEETGGYRMFTLRGKQVAGLGGVPAEQFAVEARGRVDVG